MAYIDVITIMYTLYNAGSGDDRRPVILSDSVEKAIAICINARNKLCGL